jgi:hypothetical protein
MLVHQAEHCVERAVRHPRVRVQQQDVVGPPTADAEIARGPEAAVVAERRQLDVGELLPDQRDRPVGRRVVDDADGETSRRRKSTERLEAVTKQLPAVVRDDGDVEPCCQR